MGKKAKLGDLYGAEKLENGSVFFGPLSKYASDEVHGHTFSEKEWHDFLLHLDHFPKVSSKPVYVEEKPEPVDSFVAKVAKKVKAK